MTIELGVDTARHARDIINIYANKMALRIDLLEYVVATLVTNINKGECSVADLKAWLDQGKVVETLKEMELDR